jgi:hypothetical protein
MTAAVVATRRALTVRTPSGMCAKCGSVHYVPGRKPSAGVLWIPAGTQALQVGGGTSFGRQVVSPNRVAAFTHSRGWGNAKTPAWALSLCKAGASKAPARSALNDS